MKSDSKIARHASKAADRPILSSDKDLLGRNKFAEQLAKEIHAWNDKESLVIGLYGEWGSGKTSLKNMMLEHYKKLLQNNSKI